MGINFDKALGIHEQALTIQSKRTAVLANNIANADTPGYKARDVDFHALLQQAAHSQRSSGLERTHAAHFRADSKYLSNELMYRVPMQPDTGDGNTVDPSIEQAAFAQSALQYQTSLTFLGNKFRSLMTAIRGE